MSECCKFFVYFTVKDIGTRMRNNGYYLIGEFFSFGTVGTSPFLKIE